MHTYRNTKQKQSLSKIENLRTREVASVNLNLNMVQ